jgi:hypothetical protein
LAIRVAGGQVPRTPARRLAGDSLSPPEGPGRCERPTAAAELTILLVDVHSTGMP